MMGPRPGPSATTTFKTGFQYSLCITEIIQTEVINGTNRYHSDGVLKYRWKCMMRFLVLQPLCAHFLQIGYISSWTITYIHVFSISNVLPNHLWCTCVVKSLSSQVERPVCAGEITLLNNFFHSKRFIVQCGQLSWLKWNFVRSSLWWTKMTAFIVIINGMLFLHFLGNI